MAGPDKEQWYWLANESFDAWPFRRVITLDWLLWPVTADNQAMGYEGFRPVPARDLMLVHEDSFVACPYTPNQGMLPGNAIALSPRGWAAYRDQILAHVATTGNDPARFERRVAARYLTIREETTAFVAQERERLIQSLHMLNNQAALDLYAVRTAPLAEATS